MARDAQLMHLAKTLGRDDLATKVRNRLMPKLKTWLNPAGCADSKADRCFFYDQTNHGMVGLVSTFGSDEFNDHHFHYGYSLRLRARRRLRILHTRISPARPRRNGDRRLRRVHAEDRLDLSVLHPHPRQCGLDRKSNV